MPTELAALRQSPPLPALVQAGLIGLLVAFAGGSWAVTDERMAGMDAGPGSALGGVGWFTTVWVTMTVAMMFPSIAPTVVAHVRLQRAAGPGAPAAAATTLFISGYVAVWAAAGLAAYALVEGVRDLDLGFLAWEDAGKYVAGGVVGLAALYQLAPLKDGCLRRCREPARSLRERWHRGLAGAVRMGVDHGAYCLGCCWALMASLFALGVMSLGWMALVAALIAAEKLLPWKEVASRGIAVLLAVLAVGVAFAPANVPGLTIPGSPAAMEAMERMGTEPMEPMEPALPMRMKDDSGAMP